MNYWLMKSEPSAYSIDDLRCDQRGVWDGVRNYQVRNMMRDEMKPGDKALFYHSSAGKETGVVGVMEITGHAYPDPEQFNNKSQYFDPKANPANPRWLCVDVLFKTKLPLVISLAELRETRELSDLPLLRRGNRLSILPLTKTQFGLILAHIGLTI